jgi:serine/threonine protein phosphatase PrpC
MQATVRLEFVSRTDIGLVRTQNEDAAAFSTAHGFAVLADGMGGYNAGEVASSIAVEVVTKALKDGLRPAQSGEYLSQLLSKSFQTANLEVLYAAHTQPGCAGMGTTLVAAVFGDHKVTVAHVGDSRAYRFRAGALIQLGRDHSLVQEQLDAGLLDAAAAAQSQQRNLLTRAIGVAEHVSADIHEHEVQENDIVLLCSDGLSDMLSDEEIAVILNAPQSSLQALCEQLVQGANNNGGVDNVSVVLARVHASVDRPIGLLERVWRRLR